MAATATAARVSDDATRPNNNAQAWATVDADRCVAEWQTGCSFTIIANRMGEGFNRNKVAGWLNRQGYRRKFPLVHKPYPAVRVAVPRKLELLASPVATKPKPLTRPYTPHTPATTPKLLQQRENIRKSPTTFSPNRTPATLLNLAKDGCKYPLGQSGNYSYCNQKRVPGVPYCGVHARLVYATPKVR